MIAVLGMKTNELEDMIKSTDEIKGICEIANDNADGQVIVRGTKKCRNCAKISERKK